MRKKSASYNPYPTKGPKTKTIDRDKEIEFSESYVINRTINTGSPEKFEMKKRIKTKAYRRRVKKRPPKKIRGSELLMIKEVDYAEAYKVPENYFVQKSKFGRVYCCPYPKMNLTHVNQDPTLGGERYQELLPGAPFLEFNQKLKSTPQSTLYHRVIPWDNKQNDFVYGAVQDACFRGYFDRRSLKSKVDFELSEEASQSNNFYNVCFYISIGLIFIISMTWFLLVLINWQEFKSNIFWFFLGLIFPLAAVIIPCLIIKRGSNIRLKRRCQALDRACNYVNQVHLVDSGVRVYPGERGAWIDVVLDEKKTLVKGYPIEDCLSFNTYRPEEEEEEENEIRHSDYRPQFQRKRRNMSHSPRRRLKKKLPEIKEETQEIFHQNRTKPAIILIEEVEYRSGGSDIKSIEAQNSSRYINRGVTKEMFSDKLFGNEQRISFSGHQQKDNFTGYERINNKSQYESNYSFYQDEEKNNTHSLPNQISDKENTNLGINTTQVKKSHLEFYQKLKRTKEAMKKNKLLHSNIFKERNNSLDRRTALSEISVGRGSIDTKSSIFGSNDLFYKVSIEDDKAKIQEEKARFKGNNYESKLPVIKEVSNPKGNSSLKKIPGIGFDLISAN